MATDELAGAVGGVSDSRLFVALVAGNVSHKVQTLRSQLQAGVEPEALGYKPSL